MINNQFRYVAKRQPSNVSQLVSQPFQQLAEDIKAQAVADAAARKEAMKARNSQYAKLYNVSGSGFNGWAEPHIEEYESQFKQSLEAVKSATTQEEANQALAAEILRLERFYSSFDNHSRLMVSQNSAHDEYIEWMTGTKKWGVDGTTPITSSEDLANRENIYENTTINVVKENIGGRLVSIGDYVSPSGKTKEQELRERFSGYNIVEGRSPEGFKTLMPVLDGSPVLEKPMVVGGPMYLHPDLGNRQYFSPESVPNFIAPIDFRGITSVQKSIDELQKRVDTDNSSDRLTVDQANQILRNDLVTLYNSNDSFRASGEQMYKEEYGVAFSPSDFEPDPETGRSIAEVEGRKSPKDLYMDKVMAGVGFKRNLPQSSSSGTAYNQYQETKARASTRSGLPSDLSPYSKTGNMSYAGKMLYADNLDLMDELSNQTYVDIQIPGEDLRGEDGQVYSSVIAYPDALDGRGVIAIRLRDDVTAGSPSTMGSAIPEKDRYSTAQMFNLSFDKQPKPRYKFIIMQNEDGSMTTEYERLNGDFAKRFDRDPAITKYPVETIIDSKY